VIEGAVHQGPTVVTMTEELGSSLAAAVGMDLQHDDDSTRGGTTDVGPSSEVLDASILDSELHYDAARDDGALGEESEAAAASASVEQVGLGAVVQRHSFEASGIYPLV
jgi:hypothetical protein